MSMLTLYEMWKLYRYATSAYSTYETALAIYGTAWTLAAATGGAVAYALPTKDNKPSSCIYIENKDGWEIVDVL